MTSDAGNTRIGRRGRNVLCSQSDDCVPVDMPARKVAGAAENCVWDTQQDPLLGRQVAGAL